MRYRRTARWVWVGLLGLCVLLGASFGLVFLNNLGVYQERIGNTVYFLSLNGKALEDGTTGWKIGDQIITTEVHQGESAAEFVRRLAAVMAEAGIEADLCLSEQLGYSLVVSGVPQPEFQPSALGIMRDIDTIGQPAMRERLARSGVTKVASDFYSYLAADWPRLRGQYVAAEQFFDSEVAPLAASLAAAGERWVLESLDEPEIGWYEATVVAHLARLRGEARMGEVKVELSLTTRKLTGTPWIITGQTIR